MVRNSRISIIKIQKFIKKGSEIGKKFQNLELKNLWKGEKDSFRQIDHKVIMIIVIFVLQLTLHALQARIICFTCHSNRTLIIHSIYSFVNDFTNGSAEWRFIDRSIWFSALILT